jgi:MFS superfamily sulfate permease-like transporter
VNRFLRKACIFTPILVISLATVGNWALLKYKPASHTKIIGQIPTGFKTFEAWNLDADFVQKTVRESGDAETAD